MILLFGLWTLQMYVNIATWITLHAWSTVEFLGVLCYHGAIGLSWPTSFFSLNKIGHLYLIVSCLSFIWFLIILKAWRAWEYLPPKGTWYVSSAWLRAKFKLISVTKWLILDYASIPFFRPAIQNMHLQLSLESFSKQKNISKQVCMQVSKRAIQASKQKLNKTPIQPSPKQE